MKNAGFAITLLLSLVTILCHGAKTNRGEFYWEDDSVSSENCIVNTAPTISGQNALSVPEDGNVEIQFLDLVVEDSDNIYPDGFTMSLTAGLNYSVADRMVIPSPNFNGELNVPVTVNDGISWSNSFSLVIIVNPVNDAPVITGQSSITGLENQPIPISLSQLVVEDPDDDDHYPADYTLHLQPGLDYTVSENSVIPAAGYYGQLSVATIVNDGEANSNLFPLAISIEQVNDPPVITSQQALEIQEDNPLTLQLSHLQVYDPDNNYPDGFSLRVLDGENYSFSGTAITPTQNFDETLSVPVVVNDGVNDSEVFYVLITIIPVNDPPVITGQQSIVIQEESPYTIQFADLIISDPDNVYPAGFSIIVFPGENYNVSGSTITPTVGYAGPLSIPVQVNDGELTSNIFNLAVSIQNINDPPLITGQNPIAIQEDSPYTITFNDLIVSDEDNTYPIGFTLTVGEGSDYTLAGNTITPIQNFTGTLAVPVSVHDGGASSNTFSLQVQVVNVNDPPVITGQTSLSTLEEQAVTIGLEHLIVSDPDNTYPAGFTMEVLSGTNYSVSGTTVTPVLNYFGTLSVPVRISDGINFSAYFSFQLIVNPVNDSPSFSIIPNQQRLENSPSAQIVISGITPGPGESAQQVTLIASSGNTSIIPDPVISYAGGSTAIMTYSILPNMSGTVTITLTAVDNGPTGTPHQNTFSSQFFIEVIEVNQPPTISTVTNVIIAEDAAEQSISLIGISAGPGENQVLSVTATTNKPELFEIFQVVYTSPNASGSLRVKPAADVSGVATVQITVTDNGSAIAPSNNVTVTSFLITILPVNDPPVFVSTPVTLAVLNEAYQYVVQVSDKESPNLVFSLTEKPTWLSLENLGGNKARISGIPSASGEFSIRVSVADGDMTVDQSFVLFVNTRPVVNDFTSSLDEDQTLLVGSQFQQMFSDADNHSIQSVLITQLPVNGQIISGEKIITTQDTILLSELSALTYEPGQDFFGTDSFKWKASDGYHFSVSDANATINIRPLNDPPSITLEMDTLMYEVNGESQLVTSSFDIHDPDSDSLSSAEIGFSLNYRPEFDFLSFDNMPNIRAVYDYQIGRITLSGKAPIQEYETFVKSIRFLHSNTLDPLLEMKILYFTFSDGSLNSEPKGRLIQLQYTFVELEIPGGFTPNGDGVNDLWIISRPTGLEELDRAVIRIFNEHGDEVFKAKGFSSAWDGTYHGNVLPAGPYFYTIDLNLRSKKTYRGVVTLLR